MRKGRWLGSTVLWMGLAATVSAQGRTTSWAEGGSFLGGSSATGRVYQPVDLRNSIAPVPKPPGPKWWDVTSWFKKKPAGMSPVMPGGPMPAPTNLTTLGPAPGR